MDIPSEIARLEAEAAVARKAINRRMKRHRALAQKAQRELDAAERTRTQHLDRVNREIARLMLMQSTEEGVE